MIPLGGFCTRFLNFVVSFVSFVELRFFICHSASCMQDFVPKSIIT